MLRIVKYPNGKKPELVSLFTYCYMVLFNLADLTKKTLTATSARRRLPQKSKPIEQWLDRLNSSVEGSRPQPFKCGNDTKCCRRL